MTFSILLVLALAGAPAGLEPGAREAFGNGLAALGIESSELGFHKQWATDSFFRLSTVDCLLDNPLEVAGYVDTSAARFLEDELDPFRLAWRQWLATDVRLTARDSSDLVRELEAGASRAPLPGTEALPAPVGRAVNLVLAGFRVADRHFDAAVGKLSARELDILAGEAPGFWTPDDSAAPKMTGVLHREFGLDYDTANEVKAETVLAYARKLDRRSLALSGLAVVLAARAAERELVENDINLPDDAAATLRPGVDRPVLYEAMTDHGLVTVGGPGDDRYEADRCLLIDLGGRDRYHNRAGGAVGVLGGRWSVNIDLGGDDLYDSNRPFSQGAALFGCGVLIDCDGDDIFRALHYAHGCGVFGTGVLCDRRGRDSYAGGNCVQGAGHFGTGLLADAAGNDCYRLRAYGQAFASTWGHGLLVEGAGNDLYYAGGEQLHEPLLPHEYQSFAQGFSIGWRPDASGGIGFLCDRSGNDVYDAEVYAQATSYWYSLGAFWDGDGYDRYAAAQYSQGSGIHLAVGCLVDNRGNDHYYSRLGPSQGEGHDFSVGVLLDRQGNDVYHASGGQGIGLTNSVGLFCDLDGNDVYSGTEGLMLAGGRPARGFASIGNFADLAGNDRYIKGSLGEDRGRWTNGTYGVGQDLASEPTRGDEADEGEELDAGSDSLALGVDSLFKYASEWEVGNARARVRQAREQLHKLGEAAFDYVFDKKADTKDGLESRAIELLCQAWPDTAKPYLYKALRDDRYLARNNAAYWLGKLEDKGKDGVDSLLLALRDKRVTPRRAASSLGDIGEPRVVPDILYLLKDSYEPSRIVTAEALGKLKNPVAFEPLIRALGDELFTVRSAAEAALTAFGEPALAPVLDAMPKLAAPALGHAARVCGTLAAELDSVEGREQRVRARQELRGLLGAESNFVRLVAVQGLAGMLDEPLRRDLADRRAIETDPFVLAELDRALEDGD